MPVVSKPRISCTFLLPTPVRYGLEDQAERNGNATMTSVIVAALLAHFDPDIRDRVREELAQH